MVFSSLNMIISCSYEPNFTSWDLDRAMQAAEIREGFRQFLSRLAPSNLDPNPLPILARAVNSLRLACRTIRQPCWRKTRFKAR